MTLQLLWVAIPAGLLIIALAGYGYQRIGEARAVALCPPIGEMIDVDGRQLHMIRKGTGGPTVVIENGAGGSSFIWWSYQDKLAELTTVVTYDRAGLGWSDFAALPRSMEERAADLHQLLVRANVPPPYVLVGCSYGGLLIRLFARDHRNEVAGLVFVDSGHEAVYSRPDVQASYNKKLATMFKLLGHASQVGLLRLFRAKFFVPRADMLTAAQRDVLASGRYSARPWFVGADELASTKHSGPTMEGTNVPGCLGDMPIAVITHGHRFPGMASILEKYWHTGQKQLAALSTNSTLIVAQNSYHDIPLTEPEVVLDAIRRVVAAVRSKGKLAAAA